MIGPLVMVGVVVATLMIGCVLVAGLILMSMP